MTIGELLKEYRISQGKNQKKFINDGMIVSQSYYSKVEKNANKITVDNLVDLLHYNNIPIWEFFSRLNSNDDLRHQQIKDFNNMMIEAYYENNIDKVRGLKPLVKESNLSNKDKSIYIFYHSFLSYIKIINRLLTITIFRTCNKCQLFCISIRSINF